MNNNIMQNVLTFANTNEAKKYLDKEGYFADSFLDLVFEVDNGNLHILKEVLENDVCCYISDISIHAFGFFLPKDKIKRVAHE